MSFGPSAPRHDDGADEAGIDVDAFVRKPHASFQIASQPRWLPFHTIEEPLPLVPALVCAADTGIDPHAVSRKPDEAYARIEQYSAGPRADLFARERRRGWDFLTEALTITNPVTPAHYKKVRRRAGVVHTARNPRRCVEDSWRDRPPLA